MMFDSAGFIFILFGLLVAVAFGYFVLFLFGINNRSNAVIICLSALGHFVSAVVFWALSLFQPSDAVAYFEFATNESLVKSMSRGTMLISQMIFWLRSVFNVSYLGAYSFFAMLGFLGSVLYLVIFYNLLDKLRDKYECQFSSKYVALSACLIACWPSSLFWMSGIGKDSVCYFLMAVLFLAILKFKRNIFYLVAIILPAIFLYEIRPYLFLIAIFAFSFWILAGSYRGMNFVTKIVLSVIFVTLFLWISNDIMSIGGFAGYNLDDIAHRAMMQQKALSMGTHISVPSSKGLFFLCLPYTMFANLFAPLFIGASGGLGVVASFENLFLFFLSLSFIKRRKYWGMIKKESTFSHYIFFFFLSGIFYLGMANTNLGLAMRQKTMYVPFFLIVMCLTLLLSQALLLKKRQGGMHN